MSTIHPTAVVAPGAELGADVEVGPYCVIGPNVRVGDGTRLVSHVVLGGHLTLGRGCRVFPFAALGTITQDLKYRGGAPRVEIGDGTTIREYVTVNTATADGDVTRVGERCLLMANTHVAHDCVVGNEVIMANSAALGGHVIVEDRAIVGGLSGIHQFVRIGTTSIIGSGSKLSQDLPPFMLADGNPIRVPTINLVGLRRRGHSPEACASLRAAHRILYREGLNVRQAVERIRAELSGPEIDRLASFIEGSERGILR
jgi:UDP-N-acetylglucosamine acyltransferase